MTTLERYNELVSALFRVYTEKDWPIERFIGCLCSVDEEPTRLIDFGFDAPISSCKSKFTLRRIMDPTEERAAACVIDPEREEELLNQWWIYAFSCEGHRGFIAEYAGE